MEHENAVARASAILEGMDFNTGVATPRMSTGGVDYSSRQNQKTRNQEVMELVVGLIEQMPDIPIYVYADLKGSDFSHAVGALAINVKTGHRIGSGRFNDVYLFKDDPTTVFRITSSRSLGLKNIRSGIYRHYVVQNRLPRYVPRVLGLYVAPIANNKTIIGQRIERIVPMGFDADPQLTIASQINRWMYKFFELAIDMCSSKVFHGDISDENIVMSTSGLKLIDFDLKSCVIDGPGEEACNMENMSTFQNQHLEFSPPDLIVSDKNLQRLQIAIENNDDVTVANFYYAVELLGQINSFDMSKLNDKPRVLLEFMKDLKASIGTCKTAVECYEKSQIYSVVIAGIIIIQRQCHLEMSEIVNMMEPEMRKIYTHCITLDPSTRFDLHGLIQAFGQLQVPILMSSS